MTKETKKTILVTGAQGQLGQSLQKIKAEYPDYKFVFWDLPQADITDERVMRKLWKTHAPALVINCAAYTAVDRAESEPQVAKAINADGVGVLAGLAREYRTKLIHISTDYVFDGRSDQPYKESSKPNPLNVYGRTKLEGENIIVESDLDAVIIRTGWLYSEFGHNFVKTMLTKARGESQISVVGDQIGTPTYAADLARAIMHIVSAGFSGVEIYHFSNEGQTSWADFAREIFRISGLPTKVVDVTTAQYSARAKRPLWSVLDKTKIKAAGIGINEWERSLGVCIKEVQKTN